MIEVRSFERITYLIVEPSLKSKHKKLVRRERERSWRGKGRLMQQMVVITLLKLI